MKGNARYRVEQITITKMDGVIQSHAETKREFSVIKSAGKSNLTVDVKMEENIVNIYPDSLQETINLLIELDVVKSTAIVAVNQTNGDIDRIINHDEIIEKWKKYRAELEKRFAGVQSPEAKLNVLKFLTVAENTIIIEKNLIDDLKTKMFYDLFFDEYLVSDRLNLEEHKRPFYSQLFEGQSATLNFTKSIIAENENQVQYNNTGRLQKEDAKKFEQLYDLKYKPLVKYKFSVYDASIVEKVLLDKKDKWILQADLSISEEVKNNVELSVDYKLRKIE
ncbi:hypothetical protein OQX63_15755 [Pedobacter sp. PF22-3]|uniref:hypothetical protein n=1 Tax=Pedobacter sp. PF22-3 TaxID=2994467 RepID=UPI002245E8DF|nr:hypothetical protein [Pedobacter sp. PF22-3]MCX2494945.1 hypothetical protein [Pedobacter sp. PF22-3]